ncbi:CBS domain-containing protein [Streptomyces microflavus]|uniref:CBS domain-containing protein n=1 Tax=Streptomyces microflavus TaxID=1919 RepID=UPI003F4B701E
MGVLQPIKNDASPEVRALAETLRALFSGLEIGVRRYSVRCNRDASSITRYLNASRVPPRAFIDELLKDLTVQKKDPPTRATQELLNRQYRAALKSLDTRTSKIHVLEDRLAEADERAKRQEIHLVALERDLIYHQERLAQVSIQLTQIQSAAESDFAPAIPERNECDLQSEREALREQVRQLQEEVSEARRLQSLAESQCARLEEELVTAESERGEQQARVQTETQDLIERVRRATEASQAEARRAEEAEERLRAMEAQLGKEFRPSAVGIRSVAPRIVEDPFTVRPDELLSEVVRKSQECNVRSFPVTRTDGRLLGIITNRDVVFEPDHLRQVREVMTPMPLVTGRLGIPMEEAVALLRRHKIEKLPIVDKDGFLRKMITVSGA